MVFIPGFSTMKGEPQDPEENEKTYAESQQQRALERKLREERRDLAVMKAQGAPEAEIKAQQARVKQASKDIDDFCDSTGRSRKRSREGAPVRATWPTENGTVTRFDNKYMDVNSVPPIKNSIATASNPVVSASQNVASQATQATQSVVQSNTADIIEQSVGVKKGNPIGIDEARAKANPDYKSGLWEYRNNCQRCVQTYELRRRGYDVEAMPKKRKNDSVNWGSEIFEGYGASRAKAIGAYTLNVSETAVKKELANAPDGARYSIYIRWKGSRSAHVFIAEKENGVVKYLDPQNDKSDASSYFAQGSKLSFGYFRMDDKQITADGALISQTVRKGVNNGSKQGP